METDNHHAAADREPVRQRRGEEVLEVFQFVVDGNSQGLKHARGRVNRDRGSMAAFRFVRMRGRDGRDEVGGGPIGDVGATGDNGASDRATGPLFAKPLKQIGELVFVERGEQLGRGLSCGRIESHVERCTARGGVHAALNAEAALRVGKLVGRQSQVEQQTVDLGDSQ